MQKTNPVVDERRSKIEYQSLVISALFHRGYSMAMWKLPGHSSTHLIASSGFHYLSRDTSFEELPSGFIFSPYRVDKPGIFIDRDLSFSFAKDTIMPPGTPLENTSREWVNANQPGSNREKIQFAGNTVLPSAENEKEAYLELVEKSMREIEKGEFEKVVPSRIRSIPLPDNFEVTRTFQRLCEDHPEAMVSFVHVPGIGTWIGASPEVLVSVEDGSVFKTVALAGTQAYDEKIPIKSVAWTQKEIEEQALVERYIISCFKKIRLREYEEHGPKTVTAGKLIHLRSDFTVDMKATNFPQLGSVMLRLLHPTSAVCGMPLDPAREFLLNNEGYDREFYSGYLGPTNINHNTDIYVNLRCMQLIGGQALLYAGAGVTADSIPEKEWEETEVKFNTLSTSLG